jgi:hypothetical protein
MVFVPPYPFVFDSSSLYHLARKRLMSETDKLINEHGGWLTK